MINRRIVLHSRPDGLPVPDNFAIQEVAVPEPAEGQFLIHNRILGLVPSARIKMSDVGNSGTYDPPTPLGDVIHGQATGVVIKSRHPDFPEGTEVVNTASGWQDYTLTDGRLTDRIDTAIARESVWLGMLGSSGLTAYAGAVKVGQVQAGETFAVSAAAGAVGSAAAQIARAIGAQVIGIAGGRDKVDFLLREVGCHRAVDYKAADYQEQLATACAGGVDLFFDNVGGRIRNDMLHQMSNYGRISVCGMIAEYNDLATAQGPSWLPILVRQLTVRGFLLRTYAQHRPEFIDLMGGWIRDGKIAIREDISSGFDAIPGAFIRMLRGENNGKTLVSLI